MSGALVFVTDHGLEDGYAAQLWAAAAAGLTVLTPVAVR